MSDPRGSRRAPGGYRTSILGRVDWACWLAALGFLILTVVAFAVQFAPLGIIAVILAIGLVTFDSWVNRPKGPRAARRQADTGWRTSGGRDTGWRSGVRGQQTPPPPRAPGRPAQDFRGGGFRPNPGQPPPRRQPPQAQPQRGQLGQPPRQQPPRQPGPLPGQPPQAQPPRPPFRPAPPGSAGGGDQDFRARR